MNQSLTRNGLMLNELSIIYNNPYYKEAFGKKRFRSSTASSQPNNIKMYELFDDQASVKCYLSPEDNKSQMRIEMNIDGEAYDFIPQSKLPQSPNFPILPRLPNADCYTFWINKSNGDVRVFDKETTQSSFTIDRDGLLYNHATDEKSFWINLDATPDLHPLALADHSQYILALKDLASDNFTISFLRYKAPNQLTVSFCLENQTNLSAGPQDDEKKLVCEFDPQYFLSGTQKIGNLPQFHRFMVLENAQGEKKALIPLAAYSEKENDEDPLFSISPAIYSCELIDLTAEFEMAPKSTRQQLFTAYLCLMEHNYERAFTHLENAHQLKRYSPEELKMLGWILHSAEENQDHHPNAYAVRSYAAWMAQNNLFMHPSQEAKQTGNDAGMLTTWNEEADKWEDFWTETSAWKSRGNSASKIIAETYSHYLNVRNNVDIHLRMDASTGKRQAKLRLEDEANWLRELAKKNPRAQISMRLLSLQKKEKVVSNVYRSPPSADDPAPFLPKNFTFGKARSNKVDQAVELISNIYPRTRPGDNFPRYFMDFLLIVEEGNEEQKLQFQHLLYDMRHEKDGVNQYLRVLLETAAQGKNSLEKIKMLIARCQKRPIWENNKDNIEEMDDLVKTALAKSTNSSLSVHALAVHDRIATQIRTFFPFRLAEQVNQPTIEPLPLSIRPKDRLLHHATTEIGRHSYTRLTKQAVHKPLPPIPPKSNYLAIRHQSLVKDYAEGCKQNDEQVHYHFKDHNSFPVWRQFLVETQRQETQRNAARLSEILQLAVKTHDPEESANDFTKESLIRLGQKRAPITFPKLLSAFAQEDRKKYKQLNPILADEEIEFLHQLIGIYLANAVDLRKNQHKINLLTKLGLSGKDKLNEEEQDECLQELGALLDQDNIPDIMKSAPLLTFEYIMEMNIRPEQVEDLKLLLGIEKLQERFQQGGVKNIFRQRIMGSGKTLVLGTLLAHLKADGYHLSVLVPPATLAETNMQDMQMRSGKIFDQKTETIQFRHDPAFFNTAYLINSCNILVKAIEERESVIIPPASLQAMENQYWETRKTLKSLYQEREPLLAEENNFTAADKIKLERINKKMAELQNPNAILKDILKLINTRAIFTLDELDITLAALKELNFPVGEPAEIPEAAFELIGELYLLAATDQDILKLGLDLRENKQSSISERTYAEIKEALSKKIFHMLTCSPEWSDRLFLSEANFEGYDKDAVLKEIFAFITDPNASIPKYIDDLFESGDPKKMEAADLWTLLERELNEWLKENWQKSHEVDYSFSRDKPTLAIAIPCLANNKPNEKARYSAPWKTINTTLQLYLHAGLKEEQAIDFIETFQNRVKNEQKNAGYPKDPENLPSAKQFHRITGIDLLTITTQDADAVHRVQEKLRTGDAETLKYIFGYLTKQIPSQIKVYPEQISHNAQNLASMPKTKTGYSATVDEGSAPDDVEVVLEKGTYGRMLDILLRENTTTHAVETNDITDHLKHVIGWPKITHPHGLQFQGLVDLGPMYKGKNSAKQASAILSFMQDHPDGSLKKIKGVLYWDDDSNYLCCIKEGNPDPIIPSASDKNTICSSTGLHIHELFAFFPHHKLTGANLELPPDAYILTTFSENTPLRDELQGDGRARGIFKKQHIETIVQKSTIQLIGEALERPDLVEMATKPISEIQLSRADLLPFAEFKESIAQEACLIYTATQKINNHVRQYVKQKAYQTASDAEENEIFIKGEHLLLRKQNLSLYQMRRKKQAVMETGAFLESRANQALSPLGLPSLQEIIDSQEK